MTVVLVVDDVATLAQQYAYDLKRVGGYEVLTAASGAEALELLTRSAVDCIILDLEMPGMDGFAVLRALEQRGSEVPVIVYTGTGNYDRCIQAIRLGAYGFIDKAEPMERVVREVETVLERKRLRAEVASLQRQLGETSMVGESAPVQRLREAIARVAPIPSPVLIVGESGSGKELVARDLHRHGPGANGPFVAINSAALPENLVESELFGHERGAFTGAVTARKGAFEAAERGTLFLDEIGELPLPPRPSSCGCWRSGRSPGSAETAPSRWSRRSSRPPTEIWRPRSPPGGSARISTSGSACTCCACRRCATGSPIFRSWLRSSSRRPVSGSGSAPRRSRPTRSSC